MQYLKAYLNQIIDNGNTNLAKSISATAEEIGREYLETFSFTDHLTGLLFGNVQSGKTSQVFGIICKAADLGFPVFLLLTADNVALQQQTLNRVRSDLKEFCICGENDSRLFTENNLIKPTIIVLKKNVRVLKLWNNMLSSTGFMKGNPLFIVDDEADAASLNTMVNRDRQSSINLYLDSIKKNSSCSIYLQVTGTPQALLLQTVMSGWHPYFTYYFEPGEGYLGGNFFFADSDNSDHITYIEALRNPAKDFVIRHLAVSAQILASGGTVSNCMIHPSMKVAAHEQYASDVSKTLEWCLQNSKEFETALKRHFDRFTPEKQEKLSFPTILNKANSLLQNNEVKVLIMNGTHEVDSKEYAAGCNIVIGGNTLSRGITFPGLHTIYYTRTSKQPQADTMWQHSRIFGYDRDPGMMMVYIDKRLFKLFADINASNNSIIVQIERGLDKISISYPDGLSPTRKNVLDNKHIIAIPGGTNYYPFNPDNDSIEEISRLLKNFSESEPCYQVSLRLIKEILSRIIPSPDFKMDAFQSIIDRILAEKPGGQGILLVRRNRNVAQGTGALLSPNDWQIGAAIQDKVVLTMYQVTGTKGWGGKELWVPNIKLPHDTMYYDIDNDPDNEE